MQGSTQRTPRPMPPHQWNRRRAKHAFSHQSELSHSHSAHQRELPVANETSAGGVIIDVKDGHAYVAVIARRNRGGYLEWCLPKGHLEGSETAHEAAEREVFEETGIHGRALMHLATIDYWFSGSRNRVHKYVHHFLMEATGGVISVDNDPDHEAERAEWVRIDKVAMRLAYPNERRIVSLALSALRGES